MPEAAFMGGLALFWAYLSTFEFTWRPMQAAGLILALACALAAAHRALT